MEDHDLALVLDYLRALDPEEAARERFMVRAAGVQVLETIMRNHQRRNANSQPRQPKWFGNENGQNVRKPEFKKKRPVRIPENLQQVLEIEVQVAVQPERVSMTVVTSAEPSGIVEAGALLSSEAAPSAEPKVGPVSESQAGPSTKPPDQAVDSDVTMDESDDYSVADSDDSMFEKKSKIRADPNGELAVQTAGEAVALAKAESTAEASSAAEESSTAEAGVDAEVSSQVKATVAGEAADEAQSGEVTVVEPTVETAETELPLSVQKPTAE